VLAEVHINTRGALLELLKPLEGERVGVWAGKPLSRLMEFSETTVEAKALAEDWKKKNKRIAAYFKATGQEKK
jgi:hypothetical protein